MAVETSFLNNIAGGKGCKYTASTSAVTGNWGSLVIQADDTTIAAATDIHGLDLVAYWGVDSVNLPKGAFLTVPVNKPIKSITLTDGAVILYNV